MERSQTDMLQPRTLAWIEHADGGEILPVVWFGCLHGKAGRLMVGLRAGELFPGEGSCPRRFTLCWSPTGSGDGDAAQSAMMRLHCRNGQLCDEYGVVTLHGQLEGVTVGNLDLSAGQIDFYRLFAVSAAADA